jgi:hypothetical protein
MTTYCTPIPQPDETTTVEYDGEVPRRKGTRRQRTFEDMWEARRFYCRMARLGLNPKIVSQQKANG